MDDYTKNTKSWLDNRFRSTNKNGVYNSHASIYGFSKDLLSLGLYKNDYTIIKQIEKLSAEYKIENFLEVGCAEGFTSHLIKELFKFKVYVCDLSTEAVKRAREIYGFDGFVSDVQYLSSLKDNSFDLVLCSETIEHVPDPVKAFQELKRVTKKALIVTVPAAKNLKEKDNYQAPEGPHTHLHIFLKEEIKALTEGGEVKGISINWLNKLELLLTTGNESYIFVRSKYLSILNRILTFIFSPIRKIYCSFIAALLITLDFSLNKIFQNKVFTYMAIYKKSSQETLYEKKSNSNIIRYILKESEVEPYFLNK